MLNLSFVHLQISTAYSLLSSTISIESLIQKAKSLEYKMLAITDRNVLYGAIPFYKTCLKENIKPIIGLTADIQSNIQEGKSFPLILLAENNEGYQNLVKISSVISTKTPEGLPLKWLKGYSSGLIAITPGKEGEIESLLLDRRLDDAKEAVSLFQSIFSKQHFYLGKQKPGVKEDDSLLSQIDQLSKETGTQRVVTNHVQYIDKEDSFAHECLLAVRDGSKLSDDDRMPTEVKEYYLKSKNEMVELFYDDVDALENTIHIANRCHVEIHFHQNLLPRYPLTEGMSSAEALHKACLVGLKERMGDTNQIYKDRLQYELQIIEKMGFNDYFLIVWDFMKYARENGILTGPGRGSAAGSLVAYVLRITDVDPIEHKLLFERFLNPERISMPDIDIDFPDHRRDEVIEYVMRKYGDLHVAQIITFGTFAAKAALRDTARVFGLNTKEQETLSRAIPNKLGITLQAAFKESEPLRNIINQSDHYKRLFQTALKIEGLPRHTSTHAAGVIISDQPLVDIVPIQASQGNVYLTQYPMDTLEEIGLLKMDFLGLRNLTILERIVTSIKRNGKNFSLHRIPENDPKTLQLLTEGKTNGIFQLESDGMRDVLTKLQPTSFEDIVAVNALYRPGPMEHIPEYIKRKHGKQDIQYLHPDLEPILNMTYGVIVYQEQIMQIASKMAGFSLGQADLLRRAVGKKKKEVLDEERQHFVGGAIRKGYSDNVAHEVYDLIVKFANYGFNRSHAVAYSMIAYQLAYLKAHYPSFFFGALLTASIGNDQKIAQYVRETTQNDIPILTPSINNSQFSFQVEGDKGIRFSLAAIKGVGAQALREIFQTRKEKPYTDLFDFCIRVSTKIINRKVLENLVFAGAFDEFGEDRAVLLASLDVAIEHADLVMPDSDLGDLFQDEEEFFIKPKYVEVDHMDMNTKLQFEKQALGFYLSNHPISPYRSYLLTLGAYYIEDTRPEQKNVTIGGYVSSIRTIRTKKGDVMAFIVLTDESGEVDGVLFPNTYKHVMTLVKEGSILFIKGDFDERNGKKQFIVSEVKPIEQVKDLAAALTKKLYLKIVMELDPKKIAEDIRGIIASYKGNTSVVLFYEIDNRTVQLPVQYRIKPTEEAIEALQKVLGEKNVVFK